MSRPDNGPEVVGVFDAVEDHQHPGRGEDVVQGGVTFTGGESDNSLMRKAFDHPVERIPAFETDGHALLAAEVDDLLETGSAASADQMDTIQGTAGAEGLANGMNASQWKHVARKRWYQRRGGQLKQIQWEMVDG